MINYAGAIRLLAECGELSRAIEMEHEAIDALLFVLNKTILAGAPLSTTLQVVDLMDEFYSSHITHEEEYLHNQGVDIVQHAEAHRLLHNELRRVRGSIAGGDLEATLDVVDLLNKLRRHADQFDKAAVSVVKLGTHYT